MSIIYSVYFFKKKTAYELFMNFVGCEICICCRHIWDTFFLFKLKFFFSEKKCVIFFFVRKNFLESVRKQKYTHMYKKIRASINTVTYKHLTLSMKRKVYIPVDALCITQKNYNTYHTRATNAHHNISL